MPQSNLQLSAAKRIKEIRLKKKISQEILSNETGIDRTFISHIENGGRNISLETLERLMKGLNVSVEYFFKSELFRK